MPPRPSSRVWSGLAFALTASVAAAAHPRAAQANGHPFVFAQEGRTAADVHVEGMYALNVGSSATGAVRFVDPGIAGAGVVQQLGAQLSLAPWVALGAFGLVELGGASGENVRATGGGYVSFTLLRPRTTEGDEASDGFSLGVQVWANRELEGALAVSTWLNAAYDAHPFSVAGNLQLEKRFASLADPVDVILRLGASVEVAHSGQDQLRLGVEYVGQDLEDLVEDEEAEGGAVHLIAPAATAVLAESRLTLGIAPGVVASAQGVGFGGRLMLTYGF
jgi:hypothetical protein